MWHRIKQGGETVPTNSHETRCLILWGQNSCFQTICFILQADYLQPRFLGVLVFFDSKLVTKKVAESVKKKALSSLPGIIRLMGPKHITPVRFKVLATLRTALKLNYSNFPDLNVAAWEAFVHRFALCGTVGILLFPVIHFFFTNFLC